MSVSLRSFLQQRPGGDEMRQYLIYHPELFDEALALASGKEIHMAWNALWLIGNAMHENDLRLVNHIDELIGLLEIDHNGFQREILKILLRMKLDDDQEGNLYDKCIQIWKNIHKQSSVRSFAFRYLIKVLNKYPELKPEIDFLTSDEYLEPLSPGIKKSLLRLLP